MYRICTFLLIFSTLLTACSDRFDDPEQQQAAPSNLASNAPASNQKGWAHLGPVLPSGSINMAYSGSWKTKSPREVLQAALDNPLPPLPTRGTTEVLVLPFMDSTAEGIGASMLASWHPLANAVGPYLADAEFMAPGERLMNELILELLNENLQMPVDEYFTRAEKLYGPFGPETLQITGQYNDLQDGDLEVVIYTATGDGAPEEFTNFPIRKADSIIGIVNAQERNIVQLFQKLVREKKLNELPKVEKLDEKEIETQLGLALDMINSGDSWTVAQGIDRALELGYFADSPAVALQAATYGYASLAGIGLNMLESRDSRDWSMKQYALAQASRAHGDKSLGSLHFLIRSLNIIDVSSEPIIFFTDITPAHESWRWMWNSTVGDYSTPFPNSYEDYFSPYQAFYGAQTEAWYYGGWGNPKIWKYMEKERPRRDLFATEIPLRIMYPGKRRDTEFRDSSLSGHEIALNSFVSEVSAMMIYLARKPEWADHLQKASQILPKYKPGLSALDLEEAAKAGDYYQLRELIGNQDHAWGFIGMFGSPVYTALDEFEPFKKLILESEFSDQGPAEVAGIEMTPERFLEYARSRFAVGLMLHEYFLVKKFGSPEDTMEFIEYIEDYIGELPIYSDKITDLDQYLTLDEELQELYTKHLVQMRKKIPWLPSLTYFIYRDLFKRDQMMEAAEGLDVYLRLAGRYDLAKTADMGNLFYDYGFTILAKKYHQEFLKHHPHRYDIEQKIAWSNYVMGEKDGHLETFQKAAYALPGNSSFWDNLITYQLYHLEDYEGAQESINHLGRFNGLKALGWKMEYYELRGEEDKIMDLVEQRKAEYYVKDDPLMKASYHTYKGQKHLDFGQIAEAEKEAKIADSYDSWKADCIILHARIEYEKGNYTKAMEYMNRVFSRYEKRPGHMVSMAEYHRKLDRFEEAAKLLENYLEEKPGEYGVAWKLMQTYVDLDRKESADKLMKEITSSVNSSKVPMDVVLEYYEELNPEEAERIRGEIARRQFGPTSLDELKVWHIDDGA